MEQQLNQYLDHIRADYCGWNANDNEIAEKMRKDFVNSVRVEEGSKYIKVIAGNSVHSFIVKKADAKFKVGDILKAASFKAPATNFSRGNILTGFLRNVTWTGAA